MYHHYQAYLNAYALLQRYVLPFLCQIEAFDAPRRLQNRFALSFDIN